MPRSTQRIEGFSSSYPADTAAIGTARRQVVHWLTADAHVGDDVASELAVVLSELLANAVRAADAPDDAIGVALHLDRGAVILEVCNPQARWIEADRRWDMDDPLRAGGRGLLIVRSLVDDLEVDVDADAATTTVRCRVRLDQRG